MDKVDLEFNKTLMQNFNKEINSSGGYILPIEKSYLRNISQKNNVILYLKVPAESSFIIHDPYFWLFNKKTPCIYTQKNFGLGNGYRFGSYIHTQKIVGLGFRFSAYT